MELNADDSARTLVGQNSTQKPHALQRSTTMETRPFATKPPLMECLGTPNFKFDYAARELQWGVMKVTEHCEVTANTPVIRAQYLSSD